MSEQDRCLELLVEAEAALSSIERNEGILRDALRSKGLPDSWLNGIAPKPKRIRDYLEADGYQEYLSSRGD